VLTGPRPSGSTSPVGAPLERGWPEDAGTREIGSVSPVLGAVEDAGVSLMPETGGVRVGPAVFVFVFVLLAGLEGLGSPRRTTHAPSWQPCPVVQSSEA
jgi:hypothetical protein